MYLRIFDYSFENSLILKEKNSDETPYLIIDDEWNRVFIFTQNGGVSYHFDVDA